MKRGRLMGREAMYLLVLKQPECLNGDPQNSVSVSNVRFINQKSASGT